MRWVILVLLSTTVFAQTPLWNGVLDPSRAPAVDTGGGWQNVGIPGGIPVRSTICATIAPYSGSAATINNAIAACAANGVVLLSPGTFTLSSGINFANHSNVTLRGSGANSTFLVMTGNINCFGQTGVMCVENNDNSWPGGPSHTANWTLGYGKDATSATFSSTTGLAVGRMVALDQFDDIADTTNIFANEQPGTATQEGASGGQRPGSTTCPASGGTACRGQSQMVVVTGISGTTVTFTLGLYMPNWRSGQTPGAWWSNTNITLVGVESLSIDQTSAGATGGIIFNNCYECWVSGIRSIDANRNHVWIQWSARVVVRDSYFYQTQNHASESYGVESYDTSDSLIENNIFQQVTTPFQANGPSSSMVQGFNYTIDNVYNGSGGTWMIAGSSLHAELDNVLFEGNQANAGIFDNIHGTHNFATAFRNRYVGWETGKSQQTNAFQIYAAVRYNNIIGNVLGQIGYHNNYQDLAPGGTNPQTSIYVMGWAGNGGTSAPGTGPNDTLVATTSYRWGNYDTVNAAVRFNTGEVPSGLSLFAQPVPASHAMPDSFYLSSKPPWFGTVQWPPVGPDVTGGSGPGGFSYDIPAKVCADSMGIPSDGTGSVKAFNPSGCYAAGPTNPVVPRSGGSVF